MHIDLFLICITLPVMPPLTFFIFVSCIEFFSFLYRGVACYDLRQFNVFLLLCLFCLSFRRLFFLMTFCIKFFSFLYRSVASYDLRQFHVWEFWKQSPPGKSDAQQKLPELEFIKQCAKTISPICIFQEDYFQVLESAQQSKSK